MRSDRRARPRRDPRRRGLLDDRHRALRRAEPLGDDRGTRARRALASRFATSTIGRCSGDAGEAGEHQRRALTCFRRSRREHRRMRRRRRRRRRGEARRRLRDLGPDVAIVKLGGEGVLARPGRGRAVPTGAVRVVNGLGAGDAFGGALCTACSRAGTCRNDPVRERRRRLRCRATGVRRRDAHRGAGGGAPRR